MADQFLILISSTAVYSLFAKFFLTNCFYLYGSPKFSLPNISHVRYCANLGVAQLLATYTDIMAEFTILCITLQCARAYTHK